MCINTSKNAPSYTYVSLYMVGPIRVQTQIHEGSKLVH